MITINKISNNIINCDRCNKRHEYLKIYNKELKLCLTLNETRLWLYLKKIQEY